MEKLKICDWEGKQAIIQWPLMAKTNTEEGSGNQIKLKLSIWQKIETILNSFQLQKTHLLKRNFAKKNIDW